MDSLTTVIPASANRAQRRAIQREQKKAAKKAAKKAIKLGLPVPVNSTEIPVHPAPIIINTAITTNNTITPTTTILKEVIAEEDNNNDKNAVHLHQGSSSLASSKRSSLDLDQVGYLSIIIPSSSDVSTMHDDTIIDSVSVITDKPHIISTMSAHEEVNDREETETETDTDTEDGSTERLAPLLCPVYVTQPSLLSEHRQNNNNDTATTLVTITKETEEEMISDTTSTTAKPSSFLSSPSYSLDDIKHTRIEHHAISPDDGHHYHHLNKNSDHINFLENQNSTETLVLKTKTKKFHKVILKSLKKKKATKKEKEPKANNKKSPPISTKKSWQFWKKDNDKITMA